MSRSTLSRLPAAAFLTSAIILAVMLCAFDASAHSVGQVQTAKRISSQTVTLLDPQGNPVAGGAGTDTKAQVGDILTFVIQFTPVPNSASRGGGGYITEYVPPNTEVVGARIIDGNGNTVAPKRGGLYDDGWGPKGSAGQFSSIGLLEGSMSAVYADTGIFFSTDARTTRAPNDAFITVFNGLEMLEEPSGAGGLGDLLGTGGPYYAHNQWDLTQMYAYGAKGGSPPAEVGNGGRGNTPFLFGSAVAGPDTFYLYEKVDVPACWDGMGADYPDAGCASALDDDETAATDGPVGPWQRIRYAGSEIGTGDEALSENDAAEYVRVGVPTAAGWDLSADNPLPAGTNAVRYAVGELIVGQEYFAEISLRVTGLPLDPNMSADVNCSEVFGGDAAMPQNGQDNTWRYFVPAPACVQLNLFFELSVDKLIAVQGDTLTYRIEGKNLSVNTQNNVVVTSDYDAGDVSYVTHTVGPAPTDNNGTITWPAMTLAPGDTYSFEWQMQVAGNNKSTLNRATYISTELPAPGFSVVALTTIEPITVLEQTVVVDPTSTTAGSNVHYTATVTNEGTGAAEVNGAAFVEITLPTAFSFCGLGGGCTQPMINGAGVADPTAGAGNTIVFTNGLADIPANGGTLTVEFDVTVGGGVAPGLYTVDIQTQMDDPGIGRDVEISDFGLAELLVDATRTAPPVLDSPVAEGETMVTGTAAANADVTIFVNGNSAPTVTADGAGLFTAIVPTLYGGQHLNGTAQAAGELESVRSSPDVIVLGAVANAACSDGEDNDGDSLTDYPDDPGCTSPSDPDETDVPECSDGIDNDGLNGTDFPNDPSCSSYLDDDESGGPACGDGVDNDGDGLTDFPDDPGCQDANDINEDDIAACANGADDDGDGKIDYPNDPGCDDVYDDTEDDSTGTGGAGGEGGSSSGTGGDTTGAGGSGPLGPPPDLGGVLPGDGTDSDSGCGCRVASGGERQAGLWLLLGAVGLAVARRRRRAA